MAVYYKTLRIRNLREMDIFDTGKTKGGSITVQLTSCLTGLD
jgi:hypothetical protein